MGTSGSKNEADPKYEVQSSEDDVTRDPVCRQYVDKLDELQKTTPRKHNQMSEADQTEYRKRWTALIDEMHQTYDGTAPIPTVAQDLLHHIYHESRWYGVGHSEPVRTRINRLFKGHIVPNTSPHHRVFCRDVTSVEMDEYPNQNKKRNGTLQHNGLLECVFDLGGR